MTPRPPGDPDIIEKDDQQDRLKYNQLKDLVVDEVRGHLALSTST